MAHRKVYFRIRTERYSSGWSSDAGILLADRRVKNMVFVCEHCHFELEAAAKPCQCPDCGKLNRIRTATSSESKEFQARKLEDVWQDSIAALAG